MDLLLAITCLLSPIWIMALVVGIGQLLMPEPEELWPDSD
jgi:hypothetical protein